MRTKNIVGEGGALYKQIQNVNLRGCKLAVIVSKNFHSAVTNEKNEIIHEFQNETFQLETDNWLLTTNCAMTFRFLTKM